MKEQEVIQLWQSGIDKHKLAEIYKRSYNNNVKLIRSTVRHRHDGRFITTREALYVVERVIYKSIMKRRWERNDRRCYSKKNKEYANFN